ncbi:uncharacterized protein LOC142353382 [Convolutriloba macropyga]|uniref:uncharacterized protein LOC142353382 n=1 Tax=Convolutriloba macropyga TaxID=536237 RepID=UPI003F521A56
MTAENCDSSKNYKARLIYLKILPFSLFKELHLVFMLLDLEHSKYEVSIDGRIQIKAGSCTRQSGLNQINIPKTRLRKPMNILFYRRMYWEFFGNSFDDSNLCT